MKKIKKEYVKPDISVTQVEVESALCGSVDLQNPNNPNNGQIENQSVNTEFTPTFDSNSSGSNIINGWTQSGVDSNN